MTAAADTDVSDLGFAARALAQTHPMTEAAHRYRQECLETERRRQPVPESADWAATALLVGYCLRRSEEQRVREDQLPAARPAASRHRSLPREQRVPADRLAAAATTAGGIDLENVAALSESLRVGDAASVSLLPADVTVAALDRIIATELDKRREHLREQLDEASWSELEDYIAWWVIHGYALRASERPAR